MIEKIDATTYRVSELGHTKPNLTIGGSDVAKFVPNVNMSFELQSHNHLEWFFINVNRPSVSVLTEKEVFDTEKDEIRITVGNETDVIGINGRNWEWKVLLNSAPVSNVLEWALTHSQGVEFHYQDTLENEWKKNNEGFDKLEDFLAIANRPDDVVGSYAVYCNLSGVHLYDGQVVRAPMTGKLTHIYRPIAVDALLNWVWCDLSITPSVADVRTKRITIPQTFLDTATYPVTI